MKPVYIFNEAGEVKEFLVSESLSKEEAYKEAWRMARGLEEPDGETPPEWALKPPYQVGI